MGQMQEFVEDNPSLIAIIVVVAFIFLLGFLNIVRSNNMRNRMR